jgi:tRNA1Val (adenine37-N6)-methyltransferase
MKVGTDGVLIGAWADCSEATSILDIGTGSGLIALMLAQRQPNSLIYALDIEENAFRQAKVNFENSIFTSRLYAVHSDIKNYNPNQKFDLIVSNPPYFADSLKSPDKNRNAARHNDSLAPEMLVAKSAALMQQHSRLAVIIPTANCEHFHSKALASNLYLHRKTRVYSLPHKPPKRILLEYTNYPIEYREDELLIETSPGHPSPDFVNLIREFYLVNP